LDERVALVRNTLADQDRLRGDEGEPREAILSGQILKVVAELIVEGLRDTDAREIIERADLSWLSQDREAVPLLPYREILERVLLQFGPSPILQAGLGLSEAAHPLLFVLLNTDDPEVLIRKEEKLSRFIHSRHGVRIVASNEGELVLEHFSTTEDPALPTENLASCGQHVAMLEMIGARGLALRFPRSGDPTHIHYGAGSVHRWGGRHGFDLWHFTWDAFVPARKPMAGLDQVLIDQARLEELDERPGIAAAVERIVRRDLGRSWLLGNVARELHVSTRTLQRRLSAAERTFSDLVQEIRTQEARRLLLESKLNLTAIGYACGFADSSHFNRTFKRRFGASPGSWRRRQLASEP
jgi:AraC-like DNA-binding protein